MPKSHGQKAKILTERKSMQIIKKLEEQCSTYDAGKLHSKFIIPDNSRIFANVSIIIMVVCVAMGLFSMVASIYRPRSVKAVGCADECLRISNRSKIPTSSFFSSTDNEIIKPSGNFSRLFLTASFIRFVSTPYEYLSYEIRQ